MCGSETLTTVVSRTSMKVANITAMATIHGLTWRCSADMGLLQVHRREHGHARAEQVLRILTRIEHDLHRHALDDLDVVPGRVFRREQAEAGPGGGGQAVDLALEDSPAECVHLDGGPLAVAHLGELGLLEVG